MHQRCVDFRLARGASARCTECRVQSIFLTDEQEVWETAVVAWMRKTYEECFEPGRLAVEADPLSASKNRLLGDLYWEGLGTEEDRQQARGYYESAMQGTDDSVSSGYAAFRLGIVSHSELLFEDALAKFEFAQQRGHDEAEERVRYINSLLACLERSKTDRRALRHFDRRLRSDRQFARRVVEIQGFSLDFLCDEFKEDEELVFEAARQNVYALQFASSSLRSNFAFLERLIGTTTWAETSITGKVQSPRGVCVGSGWALEFVSEEMQANPELVSLAVQSSGAALKHASKELRKEAQLVTKAVKQDGLALEFAGKSLRDNAEVVFAAVSQNASAMKFASERLRGDADFMLSAMRRSSFALRYASRELREDRDFIMEAIKHDGLALRWAYEHLVTDPDLLLEAEQRCGWALSQAPKELLQNSEFMLKAINKNNQALRFASEEFRNDHASIEQAVKTKGSAMQFAPKLCRGDEALVIAAARENNSSLFFADEELRENPEFLNKALNQEKKPRRRSVGSKSSVGSKGSKSSMGSKMTTDGRRSSGSKTREASKEIID